MAVSPGTRLGPYEVLSPLGAGGMGEVWLARDTRLDRDVAVKILGKELLGDETARRRFRTEARALAKLNHPHVAQVHDFATDDGIDYLVMELVRGETLGERLARGPLPGAELLRVGMDLAEGLAAAHAELVVHCDLKPANLRFSKDGVLKILDFGLARLRRPPGVGEATGTATATALGVEGEVSGTLPYMAPEQLRAEPLDARTDLWGAGVVLYELATGTRPFRDPVPAKLTDSILHSAPDAPGVRRPGVSSGLSAVLLKCLEKEPERRYRSAGELLEALRTLAAASPAGSAGPPSAPPAPRPGPRRVLAAAAAVVLLSAVATGSFLLLRRTPTGAGERAASPGAARTGGAPVSPRSIAVLPFVNMSGSKENEYLGDGIGEEVINALAKEGHLQVVSRTSAFSFKGQSLDAREIGKRLSADAVLEGSIRQAGRRLRVTAQLIDASNGYHLWSQTFDRDSSDIFAIQDEISRAIVGKLEPSGPNAPAAPAGTATPTPDLEAHDQLLRGRYAAATWSRDGLRDAEGCYEKAVQLDPEYGAAWAALAETLIMRHEMYEVRERQDAYAKATDAARRALSVARPAGDGHAALAHILGHHGKWKAAEDEARLAVAANPGTTNGHEWLGWILLMTGRHAEAEREYRRALELDPLAGPFHAAVGAILVLEGRHEESIPKLERSRELGFEEAWSLAPQVIALARLRRFGEALRAIDRALPGSVAGPSLGALRAFVHASAGRREEAAQLLSKARREPSPSPSADLPLLAFAAAAAGDREAAIDAFRRAGARGSEMLGFLRFLPEVRPLLPDPRMQALLKEAGFVG